MRQWGSISMGLAMMVITAWMVITALDWPFRAALFPVVIGISVFLMASTDVLISFLGRKEASLQQSSIDFQLTKDVEREVATSRTLWTVFWIFVFFLLILLLGFQLSIPIFFILFLKIKGREGWGISIGLAVLAWVSFYGLFVLILDTVFIEGWIQQGLKALGVVG